MRRVFKDKPPRLELIFQRTNAPVYFVTFNTHTRASLLATWRATERLNATLGARYGSSQFGTLNNSDPNGFAYQAFSKYFTTDVRVTWRIDKQWSVAAGIDNLNNYRYWNFHPYPQRTWTAELKFDL